MLTKPFTSIKLRHHKIFIANFAHWHAACNEEKCATAWQKAMGEALLKTVIAELRNQGSEGPPHRTPDFLVREYLSGTGGRE
jgi:hypothetical protein